MLLGTQEINKSWFLTEANRLGNRFHNKGVKKHKCLCWYNRLGNRLTKLEMKTRQVSSTLFYRLIDWQIDYTFHKVNLIEINRLGNRLYKSQWHPSFEGNQLANRLLKNHLQNDFPCDKHNRLDNLLCKISIKLSLVAIDWEIDWTKLQVRTFQTNTYKSIGTSINIKIAESLT